MGNAPGLDTRRLTRGLVVGALLAVLGIGLFALLWTALGSAGVEQFPRLMLAMCVPPAVIALLVGGYVLVTRGRGQ